MTQLNQSQSALPKQVQTNTPTTKAVTGQKIESRIESGNKTLLKGLGIAALALGMAALTVVTGGAALAVAGTSVGLEGAAMEGDIAEATVEEGNNEINNGNQGIDEDGYNRIRDGEFGGDNDAYQKYQDQAIGLWETGVMINMTAATVGTEALPVAGAADAMYGDKISSTFSKVFQYREEELVCSNNPLLEMEGEKNEASLVNEGASKAGIGKTGEGIPLEEVKPDVLKQIHADDNGAYGYLPNEGTDYYKPEYDFTDVDWTKEMQNTRKDYLEASKQIESDIERMQSEGFSKEDIAKHVVDARNQQKVAARENMTAEERAGLEARNIKKYKNPIGPTAESKFNEIKDSYIDKGIYESDDQIWDVVIQKSMQKDDVINTLLGIVH